MREKYKNERLAVLSNKESAHPFAVVDSTITQAVWSRKATDLPTEALPTSLQKTATEMLDLMGIRLHEGIVDGIIDMEHSVIERATQIWTSIRKRCGFITEYAS